MPQLFTVLTPQEAWSRLEPHLSAIERVEVVPTSESLGRVLADDTVAPLDLPHFPRSAMDGYAVRAEDTHGASESQPAYLKVVGEILMGRPAGVTLSPGEAALIHTGGMLANEANAVVMVENTREVDATNVEVVRPVAKGENVIQVGEDVARGEALLSRGSLLRPQDIGALLALGIIQVSVFQRVKVALIPTGDELVDPGDNPGPGQIRNTNAFALGGLAVQAGAVPLIPGIVRDNSEALQEAARWSMKEADIVVVSAGSSVSTRDITASAINSLGEPGVLVHGVSIRPGKPTILAVVDGKPVFGLPGNPASAMITFELFVTPSIFRLSGRAQLPRHREMEAKLTRNIPSAPGREDYVPVKISGRGSEIFAEPMFGRSNLMFTLAKADGVACIPLDRAGMAAGEVVMVRIF